MHKWPVVVEEVEEESVGNFQPRIAAKMKPIHSNATGIPGWGSVLREAAGISGTNRVVLLQMLLDYPAPGKARPLLAGVKEAEDAGIKDSTPHAAQAAPGKALRNAAK